MCTVQLVQSKFFIQHPRGAGAGSGGMPPPPPPRKLDTLRLILGLQKAGY